MTARDGPKDEVVLDIGESDPDRDRGPLVILSSPPGTRFDVGPFIETIQDADWNTPPDSDNDSALVGAVPRLPGDRAIASVLNDLEVPPLLGTKYVTLKESDSKPAVIGWFDGIPTLLTFEGSSSPETCGGVERICAVTPLKRAPQLARLRSSLQNFFAPTIVVVDEDRIARILSNERELFNSTLLHLKDTEDRFSPLMERITSMELTDHRPSDDIRDALEELHSARTAIEEGISGLTEIKRVCIDEQFALRPIVERSLGLVFDSETLLDRHDEVVTGLVELEEADDAEGWEENHTVVCGRFGLYFGDVVEQRQVLEAAIQSLSTPR